MLNGYEVTAATILSNPRSFIFRLRANFIGGFRLGWILFIRDTQAKYRESFLGVFWTVIPILISTLGFQIAMKERILNPGKMDVPYPVFVYLGMMFWFVFLDSFNSPVVAVKASRILLGRIHFPVAAIFLSGLFQVLLDFLIRFIFLIAVVIYYDCAGQIHWLWVPIGGLTVLIFGLACGLLAVPFSVLLQDVYRSVQIGLTYVLFLTPIAFQIPTEGFLRSVMKLNPVTYLIPPVRDLALSLSHPTLALFPGQLVVGFFLVLFAWAFTLICLPHIIDRMG